jgi:hypothetical protein
MKNKTFQNLAAKLLARGEVTLFSKRYNDGTKEEPDITIDHVKARVEKTKQGHKDIVVYLLKEDDKYVNEVYEVYRIPFMNNSSVLAYMLEEATKQVHILELRVY